MARQEIKVYFSPGCKPCHDTVDRIQRGRFESNLEGAAVDLIDVTSEEGFAQIVEQQLESIPAARHNGETCAIEIDEELDAVFFTCPGEKADTPAAAAPSTDTPAPAP